MLDSDAFALTVMVNLGVLDPSTWGKGTFVPAALGILSKANELTTLKDNPAVNEVPFAKKPCDHCP
jgi:hypothetical protein